MSIRCMGYSSLCRECHNRLIQRERRAIALWLRENGRLYPSDLADGVERGEYPEPVDGR